MRRRDKRIEIYFNENELIKLDKDRNKLGLSRSEYIRGLINNNVIDKKNNQELLSSMIEIRNLSNNLNKLTTMLEERKDSVPFVSSQSKVCFKELEKLLEVINKNIDRR